jgi:hypothetical protein
VTPKYNPDAKSVTALYEIFQEMGMHPSFYNGGGHVNFDLAVFDGKPKRLARFIALFLENRDVITAMFQHPGRFSTAEPHDVDERFLDKLKNFDGDEEALKKLLYNERFFNTRLGLKTKYVQLEISSYFQDVIPAEFITKDFDIKNDVWRKQFRVSPKIRKGEFRLFGAPRSIEEAHLQLKFVRALMDKALNDDKSLTGSLAPVDLDEMVKDAPAAFKRFESTMEALGLDSREYEGFYAEGLQNVDQYVSSAFYEPYETKMKLFPKTEGWLRAVKERPEGKALASKDRLWDIRDAEAEAVALKEQKDRVKLQAEWRRREEFGLNRGEKLGQTWRVYDEATVAKLKRLPWEKMTDYPDVAVDFAYEKWIQNQHGTANYARATEAILSDLHKAAKKKETSLAEILLGNLATIDPVKDPDRYAYYSALTLLTAVERGKEEVVVEKLGPIARVLENAQTFNRFLYHMRFRPREHKHWDLLLESQDFRRATYAKPSLKGFETAWGDFFDAVANPKTRDLKALGGIESFNPVGIRKAVRKLAMKGYVSFGEKEKQAILAFDRNYRLTFRDDKKESGKPALAETINRKCTLLLRPENP